MQGRRVVLEMPAEQRLDIDLVLVLLVELPDAVRHCLVTEFEINHLLVVTGVPMKPLPHALAVL